MQRTAPAPCRAARITIGTFRLNSGKRAAREGFTDERSLASAQKFRAEFDGLDKQLSEHPYLMGDTLSGADIAWFIYAHRLSLAGHPLSRLHPDAPARGSISCTRGRSSQRRSRCRRKP